MTTQFAIDYLLDDCQDCPENKYGECMTKSHCFEVKQMAIEALKQEPKTGHWLHSDDLYETYICSECNYNTEDYEKYNFCPNCGADMRGEV